MSTLLDRKYVSRYGQAVFGIQVHRAGVLADADASDVDVKLFPDGSLTPVWTRDATRTAEGVYEVALGSADTTTPGPFTLQFEYTIDTDPQTYAVDIEVGPSSPDYDALPLGWKTVVENVWVKFADTFDSPHGGPNLQVYLQTHFGRNRLANLLRGAVGRLNSASQPHKSYVVDAQFPFDQWGYLAEQSLYIETIKHLIRSYTEIPEAVLGTVVSRLDRRDYMNRWESILNMEMADFKTDLSRFKQAHLGLGNVSVLVSGGAFGNFGPTVHAGGGGAAAARGYYYVGRYH